MVDIENREYGINLFKGTAWFYARYRPKYPKGLFYFLKKKFQLDGTGSLLDLGCGTGELAIPLSAYFQKVMGIDPEPEMIAEAISHSTSLAIKNIDWIQGSSNELIKNHSHLGFFRLVTMGNSFHWMNRMKTLEILSKMIMQNGGIAVISNESGIWNSDLEWKKDVKKVIRRWLGEFRLAGDSIYQEHRESPEEIMHKSLFTQIETHVISYQKKWSINNIINYLYSTSFCSPKILGRKKNEFEEDLTETLSKRNQTGKFNEIRKLKIITAWKK